jgi:hypothetical protein
MKYLKKYEAKKGKNLPHVDNKDILKNYQYYIEDLDDISPITFDEFFNSLDLSIFSKYDHNKFEYANIKIPNVGRDFRVNQYTIFRHTEYGPSIKPGLENSEDWLKRNSFFFAEVRTGGVTGGSCWDTDTYEYDGKLIDLNDFIYFYLKPILENIISYQATTKTTKELCDILYNLGYKLGIKQDYRTNYEYYGNYDNYSCYYMTLEDLFKFLAQNDGL